MYYLNPFTTVVPLMKCFKNMMMEIFIRRIFNYFYNENREISGDSSVIYENFDVYYDKE